MSHIIAKTKHTCKIMKKDIYNKNAREAHLMAEAYENIYKEGSFYGNEAMAAKLKKEREDSGAVTLELRDSAGTQRATLPKDDPKVDELLAKGYTKVEDNEEAQAYRDMSDRYKAEDSIEVGNVYKGESYHELVIGIKGDEVFTKKITLEDGNRYDKKQMLDEVKLAGKIEHDFLNEIM